MEEELPSGSSGISMIGFGITFIISYITGGGKLGSIRFKESFSVTSIRLFRCFLGLMLFVTISVSVKFLVDEFSIFRHITRADFLFFWNQRFML